MLDFTGIASVLRGISILYWLLAFGAIGLALWKGKTKVQKALWAGIAIAIFGFLPVKGIIERAQHDAYAREAWAYFKKLCDVKSGEKIYKTYTGVRSVLVVKPLPPADGDALYDQFWMGDPYSSATPGERAELEALILASPRGTVAPNQSGGGFDFVESVMPVKGNENKTIIKYYYPQREEQHGHVSQRIDTPVSRFGISWEDISTLEDRKYWVAGSRLRVIDLTDNSFVAERVGYYIEAGFGSRAGARTPWLTSRGPSTTCPPIINGTSENRWFILKVLNPVEGKQDGK